MIYRGVGNNQSGFTLIELIVVIVVIGILAAISTVAYSGIQQRAQNAALSSAANSTIKGLRLYYGQYGRYPVPAEGVGIPVCVGTVGNLPATSDLASGQCYEGPPDPTFAPSGKVFVSSTFNTQLSEAIGEYAASNISYRGPTLWSTTEVSVRGLMYQASSNASGPGAGAFLYFFLKGTGQSCNVGVSGIAFTPAGSGAAAGATQCVFILQ